jgi:PAS domain S-box-containing protein
MIHDPETVAVITTSAAGRVLRWSRGAEILFGYSPGEAVGESLVELVVPPSRVVEEGKLRRTAVSQGVAATETLRQRRDGSFLFVELISRAVRDSLGSAKYFVWTKRDVTLIKARRDARLLEADFRAVPDAKTAATILTNSTEHIVHVNGAIEKLFGYDRNELLGQPIEWLLPDFHRQFHTVHHTRWRLAAKAVLAGETAGPVGRHKNGEEFPVEVTTDSMLLDQDVLVVRVIRDLSD